MGEESQRWTFGAVKEGKLIWAGRGGFPGRRGLHGGRRAQQHHERTRDDRFRLLLEVPEGSHDPRTVGMQLAKFTTVGSVRGSSRLD
jgi:hypothetical protein